MSRPKPEPDADHRRSDPTRVTLALALGGLVWLLLGRVTVVPFLADERRRETVRDIWREASRHLPETALPSVMAMGFWLCATAMVVVGVGLAVQVGRVGRGDAGVEETDTGRGDGA